MILHCTLIFNVTASDDDGEFQRFRDEYVTFFYISDLPLTTVEVSGEWDNWERHNMTQVDNKYSLNLVLEPGYYCYKFIISVRRREVRRRCGYIICKNSNSRI